MSTGIFKKKRSEEKILYHTSSYTALNSTSHHALSASTVHTHKIALNVRYLWRFKISTITYICTRMYCELKEENGWIGDGEVRTVRLRCSYSSIFSNEMPTNYVFLSFSLSLCLSLSLFQLFFLDVSLFFPLRLSRSLSLSLSLCVSLSLFVCLSLSPSVCLSLSLCVSLSLFLSPSLSYSLCLSLSLFLSFSVSLSLFLSLSLILSFLFSVFR